MTIAIPLLLLIFGALSFWLLAESTLSWVFKVFTISSFCVFTVIFYMSISSFLGWSALEKDLAEDVRIHSVVVKEPTFSSKGRIYLLLESFHNKYENKVLNMFGYKSQKDEPRLFSVPYSRQLHEELQKNVIPRLKDGQVVDGKFSKGKGNGAGKGGKGNGKGGKGKGNSLNNEGRGGGSESQETDEYHFYNLPPSEIQRKNK